MIEAWIITFCLIVARVGTFWTVIPLWSQFQPPRTVKVGLVLGLSWFWFLGYAAPAVQPIAWADFEAGTWVALALLGVREFILGATLAMSVHVMLAPVRVAGAFIGQELGLSMSTMVDTSSGASENVVSVIFHLIGLVLFFGLNIHHLVIYSIQASFDLVPVATSGSRASVALLVQRMAEIAGNGFLVCSPVALITFVTLVGLLVLARSAPSMNLFSVGMPVRLFVGLAALLLLFPQLAAGFESSLWYGVETLEQLVSAVGKATPSG